MSPPSSPSRPKPTVVALGSPDQPADQGLASLGLIMAVTGSVLGPLVGAFALIQVQVSAQMDTARTSTGIGEPDGLAYWWFVLGLASVIRALVHRQAGIRLWRDAPGDPPALAGIGRYLGVATAHTMVWLGFLRVKLVAPTSILVGFALVLMAWPLAIWAVTRLPRFRRLGDRPPVGEDGGFEGLAVLMAIFGLGGVLISLLLVQLGWQARRGGELWLSNVLLLAGLGLTVRAALQAWIGVRAIRDGAVERTDDFLRYGSVGLVIGAGAGGLFMISLFVLSIDLFVLAAATGVLLALLAWPALVRRFVDWRRLGDIVDGTTRHRSRDGGVTAVGWLLLGSAALGLAQGLARALTAMPGGELAVMTGGNLAAATAWYALPLAALQLWAALEVLAVSDRRRWVASLWAVLALAVIAVDVVPDAGALLRASRDQSFFGWCAVLLAVLPAVATLVLVNRRIIPQAVARPRG